MASSLSQRDLKTAGDGLLTFDSMTGREWLDPIHTKDLNENELYYALKDGGAYAGFTHATAKEIEELISHGGVDASMIGGLDQRGTAVGRGYLSDKYWYHYDPDQRDTYGTYSTVITKPPATLEVMNNLFKLLPFL